jgi:hypothetical protein
MEKGEQPEFDARWWQDNRPDGLKSAGELGHALSDYTTAKGKLKKSGDIRDADDAWEALSDVKKAVKAAIAEASRAKANAGMDATVACLKKFDRGYADELKWIDGHIEDSDDSAFTKPEAYRK